MVVIGASSGIGRQTAVLFAREGAKAYAARREARLKDSRDGDGRGRKDATHAADSTRVADMDELMRSTRERFGEIDALVYATGDNTPDRQLTRLTPEIWDAMAGRQSERRLLRYPRGIARHAGTAGRTFDLYRLGFSVAAFGAAYQAAKRGLLGLAHAVRFEEKKTESAPAWFVRDW